MPDGGDTGQRHPLLPDSAALRSVTRALAERIEAIFGAAQPPTAAVADPAPVPEQGLGFEALPGLWNELVAGAARLASPNLLGHMDTAPHPAAALTDAVVSALNNNLLFREIAPHASAVEERVLADLAGALGLPEATPGVFASGGSLANLTALFAACGGFSPAAPPRRAIRLAVPEGVHGSIPKAAAVLGIPPDRITTVATDEAGRMRPEALDAALAGTREAHRIVVAVAGGTVTGGVDDLEAVAGASARHGAWLHVDAVYGGALGFSTRYRDRLSGLASAQSVTMAPHKWLFVPRLSAAAFFPGSFEAFDARLGGGLPYSAGARVHRGRWGLQGSRRADAVTLWAVLQVLGRRGLAQLIDGAIDRTRELHTLLEATPGVSPVHAPDLNLQAFRAGAPDGDGARLLAIQARLERTRRPWVSVAAWQDEHVLRAVLLNPAIDARHLRDLVDAVREPA